MVALEVLFLTSVSAVVLFLLGMALYSLYLVLRYRVTRGPDPEPTARFPNEELPFVTVQLPVYNEGVLAGQCLRMAAALDYPHDRLQIQFLDDSDDGITSDTGRSTLEALQREYPQISFQFLRRGERTGFKAGALLYGTARASGTFLAIFDADFLIPRDFLQQTIHYFAGPDVGAVQARWDYANDAASLFTRLQANKLDAHQMFEQTARARIGLPALFHGTAGVWRGAAVADAGDWHCRSEVEDVELTVRAALKGWRVVYLDHFRVLSELPENVNAFVRQQMRWKRGWSRVTTQYTGMILRGGIPWRERLDLLARIHLTWGPLGALVMTLAVLPYFSTARQYGLQLVAMALYSSLLAVALVTRHFEQKTLREDPKARQPLKIHPLLSWLPLNYLLFGMGLLWPLSQATFEGLWSSRQVWEVTPKKATTPNSAGHMALSRGRRLPGYVVGTLVLGILGVALAAWAAVRGQYLASVFYVTMAAGSGAMALLLLDFYGHRLGPRALVVWVNGAASR